MGEITWEIATTRHLLGTGNLLCFVEDTLFSSSKTPFMCATCPEEANPPCEFDEHMGIFPCMSIASKAESEQAESMQKKRFSRRSNARKDMGFQVFSFCIINWWVEYWKVTVCLRKEMKFSGNILFFVALYTSTTLGTKLQSCLPCKFGIWVAITSAATSQQNQWSDDTKILFPTFFPLS